MSKPIKVMVVVVVIVVVIVKKKLGQKHLLSQEPTFKVSSKPGQEQLRYY